MATVREMLNKISSIPAKAGLGDILEELIQASQNYTIDDPGLAIGTVSAAEVKIVTATVKYVAQNEFKSIATQEVAFTATDHDVADGSNANFLLTVNNAGTVAIIKGPDTTGTAVDPAIPDDVAVLGRVNIAASGAIFNATTDLLSAGHITDTYTDLSGRPIISLDDRTFV